MRRTNRFRGALLIAVLLVTGLAPPAAATPLSPTGWGASLGGTVASWWAALVGDEGGQRSVFAASEVAPHIDPNGIEVSPHLDPDGNEVSPSIDPNGNEVAPHIDPNG